MKFLHFRLWIGWGKHSVSSMGNAESFLGWDVTMRWCRCRWSVATACFKTKQKKGIISVHKPNNIAPIVPMAMWPTKNALMRAGKDRDNTVSPGDHYKGMHPSSSTARPLAPVAGCVVWSVPLSALLLSTGLTQARDSESNYKDNYDGDPVRPGFVFKWTRLPRVPEMHLLRTGCWTRRLVCPSVFVVLYYGSVLKQHTHTLCTVSLKLIYQLSASCFVLFRSVWTDLYNLLLMSPLDLADNSIWWFISYLQNDIVVILFIYFLHLFTYGFCVLVHEGVIWQGKSNSTHGSKCSRGVFVSSKLQRALCQSSRSTTGWQILIHKRVWQTLQPPNAQHFDCGVVCAGSAEGNKYVQ